MGAGTPKSGDCCVVGGAGLKRDPDLVGFPKREVDWLAPKGEDWELLFPKREVWGLVFPKSPFGGWLELAIVNSQIISIKQSQLNNRVISTSLKSSSGVKEVYHYLLLLLRSLQTLYSCP